MVRAWRYLVVAIEMGTGRLWWCWTETMASVETVRVVQGWHDTTTIDGVVWDGAPNHRSAVVREVASLWSSNRRMLRS